LRAVRTSCTDHTYRTPIKFGGVAIDRVTLLDVECEAVTRRGQTVRGFGSMPLANTWAFPSRTLKQEQTLHAMRTLAERCARVCAEFTEFGHPIELGLALEEQFLAA